MIEMNYILHKTFLETILTKIYLRKQVFAFVSKNLSNKISNFNNDNLIIKFFAGIAFKYYKICTWCK